MTPVPQGKPCAGNPHARFEEGASALAKCINPRRSALLHNAVDAAFQKLAKSKFRSRFRLSEADRKYIADKGIETIRRHCEDFIRTRLAPANPPNDGKQTPMRGHPVFKAQHACACCCRDCLSKWWKVPKGTEIPPERQTRIVDFLMTWIDRQLNA